MEDVYLNLSRYLTPIIIGFGTIGAITNQILFRYRKQLRTTSCALYFRVLSTNDLFALWFVIFQQWLGDQFEIDATLHSVWYCRLSQYLMYVFYNLSPYFLALACFDRLCTSSPNVHLRKIATRRMASYIIPAMIIIVLGIFAFVPIRCQLVTYSQFAYCGVIDERFGRVLAFAVLFSYCILPPAFMITFCTVTVIFLRQQRRRVMPVNQARLRHRDNQLIKMLFIYVTTNIVCIAPFSVTYMIQIYYFQNASVFNNPLVQIFSILVSVAYATSFYMYTLGTPFYRDELFSLLKSIWQRIHRNKNMVGNLQPRMKPGSTTV